MNKLQQFQSEIFVNRKLLQLWFSDDYLRPVLTETHACAYGPHSIDPQAYFSRGDHSSRNYGAVRCLG